ncbi:MAG: zf-HC2 domain-containing protein [Bryobacterales bacterium]|nr:zf-HC2 domain-containing protein [Bryobacterales bacterium]
MTKLECKQIFAMLSEYLDRELPADLCDTIDAHIASCPPCVEFVKSLEKTVAYCRGAGATAEGPRPLDAGRLEELRTAYLRSVPTVSIKNTPAAS